MNNIYGKPSSNSIWATTALGDVFVYDPAIVEVKTNFMKNMHFICLRILINFEYNFKYKF